MAWRGWGLLASSGTHWLGTPCPSVPAPDAVGIITHLEGPVPHAPHYPYQDSWVVVRAESEVPTCGWWFLVHCIGHLIPVPCHINI